MSGGKAYKKENRMEEKTKKRPNVLLLLSDQQRYDTIGAAGFPHMHTPNLDRLAGGGVFFEQCHSTNPVCMACRHDLLTGRPGRDHGYYTNLEEKPIDNYDTPTLPRIFSENGYRTAAVGKMHFFPAREHHGFGEMYLMEELPKRRQDDQYLQYLKEKGLGDIQNQHGVRPLLYHVPQNSVQKLEDHGTMWVADRSIQWLGENGEEPFFLMCGFIQPHPPWNIPKELDGLYREAVIPEPVPRSRMPMDGNEPNPWFGDWDSREQKEAIRKAYYTAVSMVDMAVGKILDTLREKGFLIIRLSFSPPIMGKCCRIRGITVKNWLMKALCACLCFCVIQRGLREEEKSEALWIASICCPPVWMSVDLLIRTGSCGENPFSGWRRRTIGNSSFLLPAWDTGAG